MHFYFRNANRPLRTHSPHQHLYGAHHVPNDHHWVEHALAPTWKPCVRNCAQKPWMIDVCTLHWHLGSYIVFSFHCCFQYHSISLCTDLLTPCVLPPIPFAFYQDMVHVQLQTSCGWSLQGFCENCLHRRYVILLIVLDCEDVRCIPCVTICTRSIYRTTCFGPLLGILWDSF